jgi:type I restriction enzyme S subunit
MTQTDQQNVPKLRFPGFEGEWAERHLSDFCEIISGHPVAGDDILKEETEIPLLRGVNITEGRIRHSEDIDRYLGASTKGLERFFVEAGDVVLGMDGSKVGKNVAIVDKSNAGAFLIQRVARMRATKPNILDFAYHLIFSTRFHRYVDRINTSSGIPHISLKQIRDFEIKSPNPDEQRKIAGFLGAVDTKIAQLAEKKRLLEDYKKGCMQQLFSQKIRFKDDTDNDFPDWDTDAVKSLFSSEASRPYQILTSEIQETGRVPVVDQGKERVRGFSDKVEIAFRASQKPVIVFGDHTTELKFIDFDFVVGADGTKLLSPRKGITRFFYYALCLNNVEQEGYKRHFSILKSVKLPVPHPDEQRKIADFLSALDHKIDLVGQELDHARSFKQGLLQQMFV